MVKRRFRPLLKSLKIAVPRGNGFHVFRHANATLMSWFGAPLKLRQQRLGHVDGSPVTETRTWSAKMGGALQRDSEMQFGPWFWTILDQERETAQEWSLLSRL
jgi:integrase